MYLKLLSNLPSALPDDIISQRVGKLYRLTIAQGVPAQLAGEIWNTGAPAILVSQLLHKVGHRHAFADDVRFDLIPGVHFHPPSVVRPSAYLVSAVAGWIRWQV